MDKNSILSLAPHVLKRMEYSLDTFYLLNFENDDIWMGNSSAYLLLDKLNGKDSVDNIISSLIVESGNISYDELYDSAKKIFQELIDKKFLIII